MSIDVGLLVRRLLLFDKVIVKSIRLTEVPALIRAFGRAGFAQLLDAGLIRFSCGFTSVITDISRNGVRHVPQYHFSFGLAQLANIDAALQKNFLCLQTVAGLKNSERASMEQAIRQSLVQPGPTYGQELLDQIDNDLRTNSQAFQTAVRHRLTTELGPIPVGGVSIEVEETTSRVFYVKTA